MSRMVKQLKLKMQEPPTSFASRRNAPGGLTSTPSRPWVTGCITSVCWSLCYSLTICMAYTSSTRGLDSIVSFWSKKTIPASDAPNIIFPQTPSLRSSFLIKVAAAQPPSQLADYLPSSALLPEDLILPCGCSDYGHGSLRTQDALPPIRVCS
jgi:hypothetical protein